MAEETERYSTVVGQNAWKRGKYSRLKLFPKAFSVCIGTEVSLETGTEQANQLFMAEERSERLCRCSRLVPLVTMPVCYCGRCFCAGKDSRLEEVGCGRTLLPKDDWTWGKGVVCKSMVSVSAVWRHPDIQWRCSCAHLGKASCGPAPFCQFINIPLI